MSQCSCLVLAHASPEFRVAISRALAAERPEVQIVEVAPADLDAALRAIDPGCAPVVVCTDPTTLMQERARGWLVDVGDGLLVGQGDAWRTVARPSFRQVVAAIIERLDAPPPERSWRRGDLWSDDEDA